MAINPLSATAIQDALFQRADANKDSKLSGAELATAVKSLTGKSAPADLQAVVTQLDGDGDKALSLQEFEQANLSASQSVRLLNARNLLKAVQAAGIGGGASTGNIYGDLLNGSLSGSFTSTGALVGQIVGGAITNKIV